MPVPGGRGPYQPGEFYVPAPSGPGPLVLAPGTGLLVLTGQTPLVGKTVVPGAGALALTGLAPRVVRTVRPGVGALTLTGFAPTVIGGRIVLPGVGALTLTGVAPQIRKLLQPAVGVLTLTGLRPVLAKRATAGIASVTLTGFRPLVSVNLPGPQPGTGLLLLIGFAPTVTVGSDRLGIAGPADGPPGALRFEGTALINGVRVRVRDKGW